MRKLLIISYYFPPNPEIGGQRMYGLAKYLPSNGWEPIILTSYYPDRQKKNFRIYETKQYDEIVKWLNIVGFKNIESFDEKIKFSSETENNSIKKIVLSFLSELILYPDPQKSWYKEAIVVGSDIIHKEKIDVIVSTSKPETSHIIAKELSLKYRIPWIADFRDLWTQNHYYTFSKFRHYFEQRLEKKILSYTDSIVTVSEPLKSKLEELHKNKKIYSIMNGFDPLEQMKNTKLSKKFLIVYTGTFYLGKRDPKSLFKALHNLISRGFIDSSNISVEFYGQKEYWIVNEIEKYNLENVVKLMGTISRIESIFKQNEAQILLLLSWDNPSEIGVVTGKIFEYLNARRPILSIGVSGGAIEQIINETKSGIHINSKFELDQVILDYYNEYVQQGFVQYHGIENKISAYSQTEFAKRYLILLNNTLNK